MDQTAVFDMKASPYKGKFTSTGHFSSSLFIVLDVSLLTRCSCGFYIEPSVFVCSGFLVFSRLL